MKMKKPFLLVLLLLFILPARSDLLADVYDMPEEVVDVRSLGFWNKGQLEGHFRVIVTQGAGLSKRNKLFLQWICHCDKGQISFIGIDELNKQALYHFGVPKFDFKQNTALINVKAMDALTKITHEFQLQLTDIGHYQIASRKTVMDESEKVQPQNDQNNMVDFDQM